MLYTTTKSWKNYLTLCRTLERNEIEFEKEDKELSVKCSIIGKDIRQSYGFSIDASKMLITLYSPLPVTVEGEQMADMALAVCMINHGLKDGSFCLDVSEGLLYFKMTSSFYETKISDTLFEYMLSAAADAIDEYYPKFRKLSQS